MKDEAVDRTVWRTGFGRGYGPVVRQTADDDRLTFFISPRTSQSVRRHSAVVFDGHYYRHVGNTSSDSSPIKLNHN